MFVLTNNVSAAKKVIATLLATAVVAWSIGYYATAQAANITSVSDVLSDSAPAVVSDHTITFTTPTGIAAGETITLTFPTGFVIGSVGFADMDLDVATVAQTLAGANSATDWGVAVSGQVITITAPTGGTPASAGDEIIIKIGTNATGGTNQITNPTPANGNESFEIAIAGTMADNGYARVVILDTVLVTARVDTIFDFTVYGNATSTAINGTSTTLTSSSTTIPFGTLTAYGVKTASQDLTVQTNAANGFVVTVQTDGAFRSSTGADIDDFKDGVITTTPAAWESPSVGLDVNNEDTWGHWGVTSEDTVTTRTNEFGSNQWLGVTTTPTVIFSHDGPADSVTPGIGSTTIGYQVEISPLQEAGDDYATTLTYIATPTF